LKEWSSPGPNINACVTATTLETGLTVVMAGASLMVTAMIAEEVADSLPGKKWPPVNGWLFSWLRNA
jgi:roadblock/LC7 domain-containing protein